MKEIENIIDNMMGIVNELSPAELNKIRKYIDKINDSLYHIIEHGGNVLTLSGELDKHTYYVNNIYAKAQLSKLVPEDRIMITPDVELGTIIMVKQY